MGLAAPPGVEADRIVRWYRPALGAGLVSVVFTAWWLHWFDFVDLEVYRAGAGALLHGHDLYRAHPRAAPLPFTYPPFAAIVFVPLAVLPDTVARVCLSLLSGDALVVATFAAWRLADRGRPGRHRWIATIAVCAFAPLLEPVRDTLRFGQINLVLMALVLTDLSDLSDRDGPAPRWRGALIGVATAVKLTPGIFILYLLVTRRTRQACTALVAAGLATVGAFALMPSASARYWTHLVLDDRRIGRPGFVWNQSLRGAMARLTGSPQHGRVLWLVPATAALFAGLPLAAKARASGDELLGAGLAGLTGLLVSPISWDHHWVWALPVGIALWSRWRGVAFAWTAVFCLGSVSWWTFTGRDDYRLGVGHALLADCYPLAAIALMAFLAFRHGSGTPIGGVPSGGALRVKGRRAVPFHRAHEVMRRSRR